MPRFVTIATLTVAPGHRADAEHIADVGSKGMAEIPGFEDVVFFLDEGRNVYGAVTYWKSREDAERGNEILTPQFQQAFGDLATSQIEYTNYEIYEHQR
jgi:heme-degrading monooxygenase HmoA